MSPAEEAAVLRINGQPRQVQGPCSVTELLDQLGIELRLVAVAVNGLVVPRAEHGKTILSDGDEVEIVRAVGGG